MSPYLALRLMRRVLVAAVLWPLPALRLVRRDLVAALLWLLQAGPWIIQAGLAANAGWLAHQLASAEPTYAGSVGWTWMAAHITEDHLAMWSAVVATMGLCALISRGLALRITAAFASSVLTGVLALGFYKSNEAAGISGVNAGTYLLMTVWSYWLIGHRIFVRSGE